MRLASSLGPVLVNEKIITPSRPTIQESIRITAQEANALTAIVVDYESKNRSYYDAYLPLRREALFQSVESGQVSEELTRRIQALQNEHTQMGLVHMQKLKTALGNFRFEALKTFLYSKQFPPNTK